MTSAQWDKLSNGEKLSLVSRDIRELLRELISLTAPSGELDSALEESLESFEPLLQAFSIQLNEEKDVPSETIKSEQQADSKSKKRIHESRKSRDDSYKSQTDVKTGPPDISALLELSNKSSSRITTASPKKSISEKLNQPGPRSVKMRKSNVSPKKNMSEKLNQPGPSGVNIRKSNVSPKKSMSEKFNQPGPSGVKTRKSKVPSKKSDSSESVYETLTHYIPVRKRLHDESDDDDDDDVHYFTNRQSMVY